MFKYIASKDYTEKDGINNAVGSAILSLCLKNESVWTKVSDMLEIYAEDDILDIDWDAYSKCNDKQNVISKLMKKDYADYKAIETAFAEAVKLSSGSSNGATSGGTSGGTSSSGGISGLADGNELAPWAKEAIQFLNARCIMKGRTDNTFDGNASLTRAEAAVVVYNLYMGNLYVDRSFNIIGYNCDPEDMFMDVIFIKGYDGTETHYKPLFMFDNLNTVYNEADDEILYEVNGLYGSTKSSLIVRMSDAAANKVVKLQSGDAIAITKMDSKGRLVDFDLVYTTDLTINSVVNDDKYQNTADANNIDRFVFAYPKKVEGNYLMTASAKDLHCAEIFNCGGAPVYVYDKKENKVRFGTLNEAQSNDRVLIQTYKTSVKTISIYK